MIDESRKRLLIYIGLGLIAAIVLLVVGFFFLRNNDTDLPPEDIETSGRLAPSAPDATPDESTTLKNGVVFMEFGELERFDVPDYRINVIRYVLATYANSHDIASFTFDKTSIQEVKEGEKTIFTFTATDDKKNAYKVELSYIYSADASVRLLKDNRVVQVSD